MRQPAILEAALALTLTGAFSVSPALAVQPPADPAGRELPDLIVQITGPERASPGDDVGSDLVLVVTNRGESIAPGTVGVLDPERGYMIDLVLSTDDVVPPGFATFSPQFREDVLLRGGRESRTEDLEPGESRNVPAGVAGLPADTPPGTYRLCAQVDPGGVVGEGNEGNNVSCATLSIGRAGAGEADLTVEIVDAPRAAAPGGPLGRLRLRAENRGGGPAAGTLGAVADGAPGAGYMIDVVLSTDGSVPEGFAEYAPEFREDVLLRGGRVSRTYDLEAGAGRPYDLAGAGLPADTRPGAYSLCARIDPGDAVAESDEGNNVSCRRLAVNRRPPQASQPPFPPRDVESILPIEPNPIARRPRLPARPDCPDPAVRGLEARILSRSRDFPETAGEVEIAGVIENAGASDFRSSPGQQSVQLYVQAPGGAPELAEEVAFGDLAVGGEVRLVHRRHWDSSSPAEGEFPPVYRLYVVYDPDILIDGNPANDDCRNDNNTGELQGSEINGLF